MKNKYPTEAQEQELIFKWASMQESKYPQLKWLHSSLNGVRLRPLQAVRAKRQGMKSGISDMFLPVKNKNYSGLFIELKRIKLSNTSKEQKEFIEFVKCQGYLALVCRGAKEAIEQIKIYLADI